MRSLARLEVSLWVIHAALLAAVTFGVATAELAAGIRMALWALVAAPLVLAVPGLRRRQRYTYQWLALALVAYAGIAAVEVVASLGTSVVSSFVLLAALVELGLLFVLNRSGGPPRRATRG